MPFQDTLLDSSEAEEVGSGRRLRVPPPHPYAKIESVSLHVETAVETAGEEASIDEASVDELLALVIAVPAAPRARRSRSPLPPPPSPTGRHKVIPPSSPVGMLAHQLTRQIEEHMTARTCSIMLHDADVVCVEDDDDPRAPGPIFFTPVVAPPPKMRAPSRIRRSVILPWPAALMLLAIVGGCIYEHAHRGDLRQVVESSVHAAHLASTTVLARISK